MLRKQRDFWNALTWYEWGMVIVGCVPGVFAFKAYIQTVIYVVQILTR